MAEPGARVPADPEGPVAEGVSPVPGEDPDRLAEAEQSLRRIAANPTACNADLVRIAAAGPDASRGEYQEAVIALIAAVRTNGAFRG